MFMFAVSTTFLFCILGAYGRTAVNRCSPNMGVLEKRYWTAACRSGANGNLDGRLQSSAITRRARRACRDAI